MAGKTIFTLEYIQEIANKMGFTVMNKEYERGTDYANLKCQKCGAIKTMQFKNLFANYTIRCFECTPDIKRTPYEDIKKYVEITSNSGCKFNETEESYFRKCKESPKMAFCKLSFTCGCGQVFERAYNMFKSTKSYKCINCSNNRESFSYKTKDVKKFIEVESNSGCKLLSEYISYHEPLKIECSCGTSFNRSLATFKGRKLYKCQTCSGAAITPTYEEVVKDLRKHGIEFLDNTYKNNSTKYNVRYSCGFEVSRDYYNIKKSKYECPHCKRKGYSRDTEMLKDEIENLGEGQYLLLSEYKGMNNKMKLKHLVCNSIFKVTPHNFIDAGTRCPTCNISKSEVEIERILKENNINFEQQFIFDDLMSDKGGVLRFDFGILEGNELKFLLEYDGEFHYKKLYEGQDLEGQMVRDKKKNKYCKDKNIKLYRIPYWERENLENIVLDILDKEAV